MRDKVDFEKKMETDSKVDSELDTKASSKKELVLERARHINMQWPWLKVVLAMILVLGVGFGVTRVLHKEVGEVAETTQVEVGNEDGVDAEGKSEENTDNGGENAEQDREQGDDVKQEDGEQAGEQQPEVVAPEAKQPEVKQPEMPAYTVLQNTGRKLIALTFDDGPSGATTPRLLDILAQKQVKVTFFALGTMAQRSPDIIKREAAEGHEVASHTLSHQNLIKLSAAGVQSEVAGADNVLTQILGKAATLVRPPYGSINDTVRQNVGKPMILWTVDPEDWKYRNVATVRASVVSHAFDGAIVLMHDIHSTTVDAVAGIIDDLKAAGYEFLTVSELAAARGVALQNGYSYGSFRP